MFLLLVLAMGLPQKSRSSQRVDDSNSVSVVAVVRRVY